MVNWTPYDPYATYPFPPFEAALYLIGTLVGMIFFMWFVADKIMPEVMRDYIWPTQWYQRWARNHPKLRRDKKGFPQVPPAVGGGYPGLELRDEVESDGYDGQDWKQNAYDHPDGRIDPSVVRSSESDQRHGDQDRHEQ
jgi:hypothetical protein